MCEGTGIAYCLTERELYWLPIAAVIANFLNREDLWGGGQHLSFVQVKLNMADFIDLDKHFKMFDATLMWTIWNACFVQTKLRGSTLHVNFTWNNFAFYLTSCVVQRTIIKTSLNSIIWQWIASFTPARNEKSLNDIL